jgi:hypothetical protein
MASKNKVWSIEKIDSHISKKSAAISTKRGAFDIKKSYTLVRPILVFAASFLFFKPKWAAILNSFVAGLDAALKYQEPIIPD